MDISCGGFSPLAPLHSVCLSPKLWYGVQRNGKARGSDCDTICHKSIPLVALDSIVLSEVGDKVPPLRKCFFTLMITVWHKVLVYCLGAVGPECLSLQKHLKVDNFFFQSETVIDLTP